MLGALASLAANRASMSTLSRVAGYAALAGAGVAYASLAGGNLVGADPFKTARLTFPDDLATNDHWISFEAVQTEGRGKDIVSSLGLQNLTGKFTSGGGMAFLPMPSNVSTDYNPEYTTKDLDSAAGMALKPFDQAIYDNKDLGQSALTGSAMKNAFAGLGAGAALQTAKSAAEAIPGASGAFDAFLKVTAGLAVNPHKILLFTGVNFRDHSFTWKLSPKNRYESDVIRSIIHFFTFYSHPEYVSGGLFFKYPEFFKIKFHYPQYLFEIRPSVCTDIRVNYHGQGYPAYIRNADGSGIPAPAEVELTLSFKETEIVTKDSLNPPMSVVQPPPQPVTQQPQAEAPNTMSGFPGVRG
jgi:hypothetical protein